jgi:hypothetical protein
MTSYAINMRRPRPKANGKRCQGEGVLHLRWMRLAPQGERKHDDETLRPDCMCEMPHHIIDNRVSRLADESAR